MFLALKYTSGRNFWSMKIFHLCLCATSRQWRVVLFAYNFRQNTQTRRLLGYCQFSNPVWVNFLGANYCISSSSLWIICSHPRLQRPVFPFIRVMVSIFFSRTSLLPTPCTHAAQNGVSLSISLDHIGQFLFYSYFSFLPGSFACSSCAKELTQKKQF